MSIFIGLATQPGREAKENIIFFVAQSSTTLSSGLGRRPYGPSAPRGRQLLD